MPGSLAVGQTDGRRNDRQEGFVLAEILKAVLFGVVEGITEWLPISSTGHMILLEEFVQLEVTPEFWSMFLVVIQLGAIMAGSDAVLEPDFPVSVWRRQPDSERCVFHVGKGRCRMYSRGDHWLAV